VPCATLSSLWETGQDRGRGNRLLVVPVLTITPHLSVKRLARPLYHLYTAPLVLVLVDHCSTKETSEPRIEITTVRTGYSGRIVLDNLFLSPFYIPVKCQSLGQRGPQTTCQGVNGQEGIEYLDLSLIRTPRATTTTNLLQCYYKPQTAETLAVQERLHSSFQY
jgi:hypothetical protein